MPRVKDPAVESGAPRPVSHCNTQAIIRTNADDKYYAILKTAKDGLSERVLAVYNFQSTGQTIHVES